MGTETQFKSAPTISASLMELPIMKNYSQSQIVTKIDTFRKGEKNLFWFLKLAVFGGIAWCTWKYVLPPVFQAIGAALGAVATAVIVVGVIIAAPVLLKIIRSATRTLNRWFIKHKPFEQLEITRQKMIANQSTFRVAKQNLISLRQDMENESKRAQEDAETGQRDILKWRGKAEKTKAEMEDMIAKMGVAAKGEDDYVTLAARWQKELATATQIANKTKQSQEFTVKYGTRVNVLKKVNQKLVMAETAMEIKISDFDTTVEMLKKDYNFGQKLNSATTAVKSVLGNKSDWERDYALEVINSTIDADVASSIGNFKDIEMLTSNYDLNSDDLFDNLNAIADKIETGGDVVPQAKTYANPEYNLTSDDKSKAGAFGEMF